MTNGVSPIGGQYKSADTLSINDLSKAIRLIYQNENLSLRCITATAGSQELIVRDSIVLANATAGNVVINLCAANSWGSDRSPIIIVRRIDATANTVDILAEGGETINGAASISVAASTGVVIVSNSVNGWWTL